jgi:hypothetical protein
MLDEICDRTYQAGRSDFNATIIRSFSAVAAVLRRTLGRFRAGSDPKPDRAVLGENEQGDEHAPHRGDVAGAASCGMDYRGIR